MSTLESLRSALRMQESHDLHRALKQAGHQPAIASESKDGSVVLDKEYNLLTEEDLKNTLTLIMTRPNRDANKWVHQDGSYEISREFQDVIKPEKFHPKQLQLLASWVNAEFKLAGGCWAGHTFKIMEIPAVLRDEKQYQGLTYRISLRTSDED